jgi:adenine-specific DNA-methyltransferase
MKKKKITSKIQFLWEGKEQAQNECNTPPKYTYKLPETIGNEIHCVDNLDFLKLNQERLKGKVKCIYIDPPYNTGNDFIYKDKRHSKGECKHSKWLSFMLPRLKLARDLLREDGVIFISIDDNEQANLKLLMDEVFGEGEFVGELIWTNKEGGGGSDSKNIKVKHEYILVYAKDSINLNIQGEECKEDESYNKEDKYKEERGRYKLIKLNSFSIQYSQSLDYEIISPDNTIIIPSENGKRGCWRWSREKFEWGLKNDFIEFAKRDERWIVYTKQYFKVDNECEQIIRRLPPNALIDKYSSTMATKQLMDLMNSKIFDFSKPVSLIKHLLTVSTTPNDLVLDFFAGSGTTGQAVMELNHENPEKPPRKFILVQWNEEIKEGKEAHKFCVENGLEPVISSITVERLRRAGAKYKGDVGFEVFDY